jgi:hypothetical protein
MTAHRPPQDPNEEPVIRQHATTSGGGRVFQAGRDQTVNEVVLPEGSLRPVDQVDARPGLVNIPAHSRLFIGRADELVALDETLGDPGAVVVAAMHGLVVLCYVRDLGRDDLV